MQRGFLQELELHDEDAFMTRNFAPLGLRRRIGILGFIHKRVLTECHPSLLTLMPNMPTGVNLPRYLHGHCIESSMDQVTGRIQMYFRSLYNYIHIYNRLPQEIVAEKTVSAFQAKLTHLAKYSTARGDAS